jgi:hypothetical protein
MHGEWDARELRLALMGVFFSRPNNRRLFRPRREGD